MLFDWLAPNLSAALTQPLNARTNNRNRIAVLPARGGSKRIPRKNIKAFCGKPLICYSIEAALESGLFSRVVVSTDCEEVAGVAADAGAEVPFMRPVELASDQAGTFPVVRHAIGEVCEQISSNDVCCIYPTAPLMQAEDLIAGYELLNAELEACQAGESAEANCPFVVAVAEYAYPIQRALARLDETGRLAMREPELSQTRSQDLSQYWHDAGQFYWGTAHSWQTRQGVFESGCIGAQLPRNRVVDIDTLEDWQQAELLYEAWQLLQERQANIYKWNIGFYKIVERKGVGSRKIGLPPPKLMKPTLFTLSK